MRGIKFKLDLNRLHRHALRKQPRGFKGNGKTTYFIYQMIGIAQTKAFFSNIIYIPYNVMEKNFDSFYRQLQEICEVENLSCSIIKKKKLINLRGTFFYFVPIKKVSVTDFVFEFRKEILMRTYSEFVWWDNEEFLKINEDQIHAVGSQMESFGRPFTKKDVNLLNSPFYNEWNDAVIQSEVTILSKYKK